MHLGGFKELLQNDENRRVFYRSLYLPSIGVQEIVVFSSFSWCRFFSIRIETIGTKAFLKKFNS